MSVVISLNEITDEQVWYFADKSQWGEGEWLSEPDKMQWTDPATGLPCLIVRNELGVLCGYVGVSELHPWFEKDFSGEPIENTEIHGGLTFSGFCQEADKERGICHIPKLGQTDKVWWFGFDTAHGCDVCPAIHYRLLEIMHEYGSTYKNIDYVKSHVTALAATLHIAELRQRIVELLSDPVDFRGWLASFQPEEAIGVAMSCRSCPIARFLEARGVSGVEVFSYEIQERINYEIQKRNGCIDGDVILRYEDVFELQWVGKFIQSVDKSFDDIDLPIPSKAGLETLGRIVDKQTLPRRTRE